MSGFIGVHVGAGYHSEKNRSLYSEVCKKACLAGTEVLRNGGDSLEAVCVATSLLEDSPMTNAGIGSSLTWDSTVECDASVMDSTGRYGAVGAVSGIKNPILLAREICLARARPLSLERVPPSLLVGSGAVHWSKDHGISTVEPSTLVTDKTRRQHIKCKSLALGDKIPHKGKFKEKRLDTVGAVCMDSDGRLSAAASSGGTLLKVCGRVGQAAQYGAGVWAQLSSYPGEDEERCLPNHSGVAVATSGTGEQLVTTLLARTVSQHLLSSACPAIDLHCVLKQHFLGSPFLQKEKKKLCGVLVLKTDDDGRSGELLWGHSTETMGIGYMSTNMKKPKSLFSTMERKMTGCEPSIGGIRW